MPLDLLSDVLALVRLTGALVFEVEVGGAWGVSEQPCVEHFAPLLPAGTAQVVAFHIMLQGACVVRHAAAPWVELHAGQAIVVAHGEAHCLCDRPGSTILPFATVLGERRLSGLRHLRLGDGTQAPARLLCGFLGCDHRAFEPLRRALPSLFKVELSAGMHTLARSAVADALDEGPGSDGLRGRLAELLFLGALRQYIRGLPPDATGWLAGLRDPLVGRALQALHREPCRHWTVDELALCTASSRSTLAERFRDLVGEPPMHYLARLRMQLASRLLDGGRHSIEWVAGEVGYDSSAAFQRAFKRSFGVPPATWRRHATPAQ